MLVIAFEFTVAARSLNINDLCDPRCQKCRGVWGKTPMLRIISLIYINVAWNVTTSALLHYTHTTLWTKNLVLIQNYF